MLAFLIIVAIRDGDGITDGDGERSTDADSLDELHDVRAHSLLRRHSQRQLTPFALGVLEKRLMIA